MRTVKAGTKDWERYREVYRWSLWDFCHDILGYRDIDYPFFHEECKAYDENLRNGVRFQMRMYPRFHLKSSIYTIGACLQDLCRDRNYTIGIISDTDDMAQGWLKVIADNIIQNETLYFWFPEIRPQAEKRTEWNKKFITINRDALVPDPSIFACGITTNIVGKHPKKLLLDDVVTFENTDTPQKIEKTKTCYEYLISLPDPKTGRIEVNGTRYSFGDLYDTLIKTGIFSVREKQVEENGVYIFPAKFDAEAMANLKKLGQSDFIISCQYYNRPIMHADQLFQEEMFQEYEELPEGGQYYVTVDPASSVESSADYSAIVTCYWAPPNEKNPMGAIYIKDYVYRRMKTDLLVETMINKYIEIMPYGMSIEIAGAFGGLWEYFWSECHKKGLFGISVSRFVPKSNQSKYERISMLQPWFKRRQVYLRKEHQELKSQMLSYTGYKKKEKDDLVDALAQQLTIGKIPNAPNAQDEEDDYEPLYRETAF